jgi:hypothetical protein
MCGWLLFHQADDRAASTEAELVPSTLPDLVQWLTDEARKLAQKAGTRPDTLILGSSAARAFMANPGVQRERGAFGFP